MMKIFTRIITTLAIILVFTVANKSQTVHASTKAVLNNYDFVLRKTNNAEKTLVSGKYSMASGEVCKLIVDNFKFSSRTNNCTKSIDFSSSNSKCVAIEKHNGNYYLKALKKANSPIVISAKVTIQGSALVSEKVLVKKIKLVINSAAASEQNTEANCKHPDSRDNYIYINPNYHKLEKRCSKCNALLDYRYEKHNGLCSKCAN